MKKLIYGILTLSLFASNAHSMRRITRRLPAEFLSRMASCSLGSSTRQTAKKAAHSRPLHTSAPTHVQTKPTLVWLNTDTTMNEDFAHALATNSITSLEKLLKKFPQGWPTSHDGHPLSGFVHWALENNNLEALKAFIEHDPMLLHKYYRGKSPLEWAIEFYLAYGKDNQPEIISFLLRKRALDDTHLEALIENIMAEEQLTVDEWQIRWNLYIALIKNPFLSLKVTKKVLLLIQSSFGKVAKNTNHHIFLSSAFQWLVEKRKAIKKRRKNQALVLYMQKMLLPSAPCH